MSFRQKSIDRLNKVKAATIDLYDDEESFPGDLLADLMHSCDDFEQRLELARMYHENETNEDEDQSDAA